METEKVCVNLSGAELGAMDVLVAQGLYTNRSDAIRAGLRRVIADHDPVVKRATRDQATVGLMIVGRRELERLRDSGKRTRIFTVGILRIERTVSADLADETIDQIRIIGSLRAPDEVVERLGDRIVRGLPAFDTN